MKTAELTGELLDRWAAKAIALTAESAVDFGLGCPDWLQRFKPSTDWAQGGPICQEARIEQFPCGPGPMDGYWRTGIWRREGEARVLQHVFFDLDPLVAAMRTKVASVYGDEVPDLTNPA